MPLRNIKALVEYDGTNFKGFQIQPKHLRTVQGDITDVLTDILNHSLKVKGASRTDAGVHAQGQVITFKTSSSRTLKEIEYGANRSSADDWKFVQLAEVNWEFHPRYDAKAKTYVYFIDKTDSVLRNRYSWGLNDDLNINIMKSASVLLIGTMDFKSFTTSNAHQNDITFRLIDRIDITESGGLIAIEIIGSGFLYQMVRRIVRALVNVGCGRITLDDFSLLTEKPEFDRIDVAAPAKGLILKNIQY